MTNHIKRFNNSRGAIVGALQLLLVLIISVFLVEALIMVVLNFVVPTIPPFVEIFVDALSLSILVYPILYFFSFRPMQKEVAERKRREEESKYMKQIVEETSDFVAMGDTQLKPFYFNKAARRMLGYGEKEDMSGVRVQDTHPDRVAKIVFEEGIPAALREGSWKGETVLLSRDGKEIPVSQVIIAHKTPKGELSFYSTVMRDISEQKKWEKELEAKSIELAEKVKELEQVNKVLMGREERILELKQEVETLRSQLPSKT